MTPLYEGKYGHSIAVLVTFESGKGGIHGLDLLRGRGGLIGIAGGICLGGGI